MTTDSRERGFVLPAVLMALTVLYLIAAVGYTWSTLETRMSEAHAASVQAFYLADGAMRDVLAVFEDSASSRSRGRAWHVAGDHGLVRNPRTIEPTPQNTLTCEWATSCSITHSTKSPGSTSTSSDR